jgi:hypothetical protein
VPLAVEGLLDEAVAEVTDGGLGPRLLELGQRVLAESSPCPDIVRGRPRRRGPPLASVTDRETALAPGDHVPH